MGGGSGRTRTTGEPGSSTEGRTAAPPAGLACAALLLWPLATAAQPAPAAFRGGGPNLGVVETAGVERLGGLAWRFRTGGPVRSSPTLAGGVVYVGSADGHLYALDAATGALRWKHGVGSSLGGAPLVTAERVVFTDRRNRVHALDRTTGAAVWRTSTGPDLPLDWGWEGWDYLLPSAALVPGPGPGEGTILVGSGDGHLYALEPATGEVRWRFATGGRIRGTPAVHDGVAYVGSGDGVVYGVAVGDGAEVWRFATRGIGLDARDFGFDRTQIQASPAVADGILYVGSRDASLYAVELATGRARWTEDEGTAWVVGSAAVRGGRVFSGRSSSGTVKAVDAATGAAEWVVETGGPVFSSPVVVGGSVYVSSGGGRLLALDAADGTERWSYPLGAGSYSTPTVWEGRIYVGSDDGHVYALRAAEGPAPRMGVYWDEGMRSRSALGAAEGHRALADHFWERGYEVLDTAALRAFLEERVRDGAPSAVVFPMDGLPRTVADPDDPPGSLLRRYLDGGGKAVWLGRPPLLYRRDESGAITDVDRDRPSGLLDVDLSAWNGDLYGVEPTDAGRRQGLLTGWVGEPWMEAAAAREADVVALALDELGRVSAWAKRYGGGPGSGFVVLRASTRWDRLEDVRRVAEYGVLRDPVAASR